MQPILYRPSRVLQIAVALFPLIACVSAARADIYQWEYSDPADPSQGKRQSATLAPDGAGAEAKPGADLSNRNLSMAYLAGADFREAMLTSAYFYDAELTGANLSHASLANVNFRGATLTDANFTGAEVRGADFRIGQSCNTLICFFPLMSGDGTGVSLSQLYSTASYRAHDLREVLLDNHHFDGANFAGQNFTNTSFLSATITDADFTGAQIRGANFGITVQYPPLCGFISCNESDALVSGSGIALEQLYSTASYKAHDLSGVSFSDNDISGVKFAEQNLAGANFSSGNLTNVDFRNANLARASFGYANVSEADFTGADIRGAYFFASNFTRDKLYSTSSYRTHDISAISLFEKNVSGWNFAGQKLFSADFGSCVLNGADFSAADARGARFDASSIAAATTINLIRPDGHIIGLDLAADRLLVVRDYHDYFGQPKSFPITVDQHLTMGPGGTLRMEFEADAWDSTISLAPGISGTLGGTLELTFAEGVDVASQVGRRFDLFNWDGVNPTGTFTVSSPYTWDVSNLYTTGEVILTAIPEPNSLVLMRLTLCVLAPHRNSNRWFQLAAMLSLVAFASQANADIYQWEYIDPADPSQGKRQSAMLAPDGAGVDAVPGANLSFRDLTMAHLIGADLTGADVDGAILTNADLSGATLTFAYLGSTLIDTNFTGAKVNGTHLGGATLYGGFTVAQLYSTASYQAHDLSWIDLRSNDLSSWNFAGQNLTGAYFAGATLTGADFTGAQVQGAGFPRGYIGTGVTLAQLSSTASYQMNDLSEINLEFNDLHGGNFAGQNLPNADFGAANLSGANFREANLVNVNFTGSACLMYPLCVPIPATLTNVDLTASDARGAFGLNFADATTTNLIQTDGHISDLDLHAGGLLVVRDYDGDPSDFYGRPAPPIAIAVDQHLTMGAGGTLRMVFEADAWDSTISFAPGIPVALGGRLELTFADGVNLATQLGRTFDLFDWTGVNPTGAFAISSPYAWDMSHIYTTGEVTFVGVPEPLALFLLSFALTAHVAVGRVRLRSI